MSLKNIVLAWPSAFLTKAFSKKWAFFLFIVILIFRIVYGLTEKFWDVDEVQTYLIGLEAYSNDEIPAFGPDTMYKVRSRIPGGLIGTLIYLPLLFVAIPESPIIFLNILNFLALYFFARYLIIGIPEVASWIIYCSVLLTPWTMHFGTSVINTSYVLIPSIGFFISFFERTEFFSTDQKISRNICYSIIGFSLVWLFQIHMSWVLMGPFGLWIMLKDYKSAQRIFIDSLFVTLGGLISGLTLFKFFLIGGDAMLGGTENNVSFNADNLFMLPEFVMRFVLMGTFEIARFSSHIEILINQVREQVFIIPVAAILLLGAIFQGLFFLYNLIFSKSVILSKAKKTYLIGATIVFCSYLFSVKPPISYTFYFMFPFILAIVLVVASQVSATLRDRWYGWIILLVSLFHFTHIFYGLNYKSLYTNRAEVALAIELKEPTLMGMRRVAFFEDPNFSVHGSEMIENCSLYNSFEYNNELSKPKYYSKNKSASGKTSMILNHNVPYSRLINLSDNCFDELNILKVQFSYNVTQSDTIHYVIMDDTKAQWPSEILLLQPCLHDEWIQKSSTIRLNLNEMHNPKLFFWKSSATHQMIYLDDCTINIELNQ